MRTRGNPSALADAVRKRIHELEPARSVYGMMPLADHLDQASLESRGALDDSARSDRSISSSAWRASRVEPVRILREE